MENFFAGIQLGNSSAKLSVYNATSNSAQVITNEDGDRILPVNVATHSGSDELSFQLQPVATTARSVSHLYENFFAHLCNDEDCGTSVSYGDEAGLGVRQLCVAYLQRLIEILRLFSGAERIQSLVVSLSASLWNGGKGAERIARLISEEFSATIATVSVESQAKCSLLEWTNRNPSTDAAKSAVLVLEVGHSSSWLTQFYRNQTNCLLVAQPPRNGSPIKLSAFSGTTSDTILYQMVLQEAQRKFKTDEFSKKMLRKLVAHCHSLKRTLSQSPSATLFIESFYDGIDFSFTLHRSKYEAQLDLHLRQLMEQIKGAFKDLSEFELVIVGSSCKKPHLAKTIRNAFPQAVIVEDPDEIGAKGASLLASLSRGPEQQQQVREYAAKTLVLKDADQEFVLVSEGTLLPVANDFLGRTFVGNEDGIEYSLVESSGRRICSFKATSSFTVSMEYKPTCLALKGTKEGTDSMVFDLSIPVEA